MQVTLVKKIKADGTACRKCAEVEKRLGEGGYLDRIDRIIVADERDPESEGMRLAAKHGIEAAPFFVVEGDDGSTTVYTVFFRFLKEVLQVESDSREEASDLMDRSPGLDML